MIRKKVEIREMEELGRALFFNGEPFDWGMDPDDLDKAKQACKGNRVRAEQVLTTIQQHLLGSLEEFLGKKVSLAELNKAIADGYIDL